MEDQKPSRPSPKTPIWRSLAVLVGGMLLLVLFAWVMVWLGSLI